MVNDINIQTDQYVDLDDLFFCIAFSWGFTDTYVRFGELSFYSYCQWKDLPILPAKLEKVIIFPDCLFFMWARTACVSLIVPVTFTLKIRSICSRGTLSGIPTKLIPAMLTRNNNQSRWKENINIFEGNIMLSKVTCLAKPRAGEMLWPRYL